MGSGACGVSVINTSLLTICETDKLVLLYILLHCILQIIIRNLLEGIQFIRWDNPVFPYLDHANFETNHSVNMIEE